jgi:tetratricopeptide (TPR) repeat protein
MDAIHDLVNKSLVAAGMENGQLQLRLLETTRTYALSRLRNLPGRQPIDRSHALWYAGRLRKHADDRGTSLMAQTDLDNLRAALEWAFVENDLELEFEISAGLTGHLLARGLLRECRRCGERALRTLPDRHRATGIELKLLECLVVAHYSSGDYGGEVERILDRALALASDVDRQVYFHLLAGKHLFLMTNGKFADSLAACEVYARATQNESGVAERIVLEWIRGASYHYMGRQDLAGQCLDRSLDLERAHPIRSLAYFELKQQIIARVNVARVALMSAQLDRAQVLATIAIRDARKFPDSFYMAVTLCCPVLLQSGQSDRAADLIADLEGVAREYKMAVRGPVIEYMQGRLQLHRRQVNEAIGHLRQCLAMLPAPRISVLRTDALQALAEALLARGDAVEAQVMIEEAIELAEITQGVSHLPDLMCTQAQVMMRVPGVSPEFVSQLLHSAMECARTQSASHWEQHIASIMAQWAEVRPDRDDPVRPFAWGPA